MIEELYEIYKDKQDNFLLSPYSIHIALAMAKEGAKGQTLEEMNDVLGPDPVIIEDETLHVANAIWTRCEIEDRWKKIIHDKYKGRVTDITYLSNPEGMINAWVYANTKRKIPTIIDRPLDPVVKMIITNAIHFKDDWCIQFKEKNTMKDTFWVDDDSTVNVHMMSIRGSSNARMGYAETDDLQVLEMRYVGKGHRNMITMNILLPKSRTGRVSGKDIVNVSNILRTGRLRIVDLWLPKIKMEGEYHLEKAMKDMGMKVPFSNAANFSGMSNHPEGLKIDEIIHKTYVDINEEGTEAAAVTGLTIRSLSAMMPPPEERVIFRADHPYVFLIRHGKTILFMGAVNNPGVL